MRHPAPRRAHGGRVPSALLSLALWAAAPAVQAQASVPWTPTLAGRHAIELLVDDGGLDLTTTQWPLPSAAVRDAIDALPVDLPEPLARARDRVRAELQRQQATLLTLTARNNVETLSAFGDDATPGSSLELRSAPLIGPHLALQVGVRLDQQTGSPVSGGQVRLDDSAVATEWLGIELQGWAHRGWWGPGWQNALSLSNNTPALSAVGLQRASASTSASPWLSWLGPWNFETFVGRAEGRNKPSYPFIVGTRLSARPLAGFEIGLQRMAQWGGGGRSQTLASFANMYFERHINADTAAQRSADPANEMAGYDLRVHCPAGLRCAGYAQAIGEDEAGLLPTDFLEMLGFEWWTADGGDRFFVEEAHTACHRQLAGKPEKGCAYNNYAYLDGFTSGGRWIGDSAGRDSQLFTLGWIDAARDSSVRVHVGHIGVRIGTVGTPLEVYGPVPPDAHEAGRVLGLAARRSFTWGPTRWTPELDLTRIRAYDGRHDDLRLGLEMSADLDAFTRGVPGRLGESLSAHAPGGWATQAAVGLALVGGAALLDHPSDDFARNHVHDTTMIGLRHVGDALPFIEAGAAGLAWMARPAQAEGEVARAAVLAGASACAAAQVLKEAVDRARPRDGRGQGDFGNVARSQSSFPSFHTALAWSVLTPFAQYYDAPWLYGVAALTNGARIAGRAHWLSDTVAGSVMGYVIGDEVYAHSAGAPRTRMIVGLHTVGLSLPWR